MGYILFTSYYINNNNNADVDYDDDDDDDERDIFKRCESHNRDMRAPLM